MSVYRYNHHSLINEVTFVKTEGGGIRAYLHSTHPDDSLLDLREKMDRLGWQNVPVTKDGATLLEIRGFKTEPSLLAQLKLGQFINGKPEVSYDQKISIWDSLRHNRLFLSGVCNVIADLGYFLYTYMDRHDPHRKPGENGSRWQGIASSVAYSTGSLILFGFGHADKSDQQLKDLSQKMQDFVKKRGLSIPETSAVESFAVDHQEGWTDNLLDNLKRYNSEVYNTFTGLAGFFIGWGALKHNEYPDDPKKNRRFKINESILGGSTLAAGLTAAYIKEKAPDPTQKKSGLAGIKAWFQERPNRIAGYGYMISSLSHGANTIADFGQAMKDHHTYGMIKQAGRGFFVVVNLLGEYVLSTASKGHGSGVKSDPGIDLTACAIAADYLLTLPAAQREEEIQAFGKFLANPEHLGGHEEEVIACLREQVACMEKNHWVKHNHINNGEPASNPVTVANGRAPATAKKSSGMQWDGRVSQTPQEIQLAT